MIAKLRAGRPLDAVLTGIDEVGRVLAQHFPRRPDDQNELPDHVSVR
jgi:putative membrane protein